MRRNSPTACDWTIVSIEKLAHARSFIQIMLFLQADHVLLYCLQYYSSIRSFRDTFSPYHIAAAHRNSPHSALSCIMCGIGSYKVSKTEIHTGYFLVLEKVSTFNSFGALILVTSHFRITY